MTIGTQLKTRVNASTAGAIAEATQSMGSPVGIKVEAESSDQATVTIDTAALKAGARMESSEALAKRAQSSAAARDANFTQGQANSERGRAQEDKAEAGQAKSRVEELKGQAEKDRKEKAELEAEIVELERAKREAENARFQAERAARDYKTLGEDMLAKAGGDPIKLAQAFDKLELAARQQATAEQAGVKALTSDEVLSTLRSKSSSLGEKIQSMVQEQGFLAENAQSALKSAAQREAAATEKDAEAAKFRSESQQLAQEAKQAQANSQAQSAVAAATDAKVVSAVAAAI